VKSFHHVVNGASGIGNSELDKRRTTTGGEGVASAWGSGGGRRKVTRLEALGGRE